jgi:hypothetical protein
MDQYAELKERLVRMKTLRAIFSERMDQLIAEKDAPRAKLYGERIVYLDSKIPAAEADLREMFELHQRQKAEVRYWNDEAAAFTATGMLAESLALNSAHRRRAESIQALTQQLRATAKRAQSLMEVNQWEETLAKP